MPETHSQIWWAVYHSDRFTSLLLNLPLAFSDKFYEYEASQPAVEPESQFGVWLQQFVHFCAITPGEVIDRNINPTYSLVDIGRLSKRVTRLRDSAPSGWWGLPNDLPPVNSPEHDILVDRLLVQFFFFHVEMYTHIPSMTATANDKMDKIGGMPSCGNTAREMLKRFLILRSQVDGTYLCKASAFVGFTAAVVLVLWMNNQPRHQREDEDGKLIRDICRVFSHLERATGCKIAAQCYKTL